MLCTRCGETTAVRCTLTPTGREDLCPACLEADGYGPVFVIGLSESGARKVAAYLAGAGVGLERAGDYCRAACAAVEEQINGTQGHILDRRGPWGFQAGTGDSLALDEQDFVSLPAGDIATAQAGNGGGGGGITWVDAAVVLPMMLEPQCIDTWALPAPCRARLKAEARAMTYEVSPYDTAENPLCLLYERAEAILLEFGVSVRR